MNAATLQIRTPEGIVFSQTLAGPIARFLAWALDFCCMAAVLMLLRLALWPLAIVSADVVEALNAVLYFGVAIGYSMIFEWFWRGQTPGKRVLRLRVVDAQGLQLHFSQIAFRNLLRVVDGLPMFYLVGGLATIFTRHAQRLGDMVANTVVIRIPKIIEPNLDQLLPDKFNSLRGHPHLAARLRQRVSPEEASIALEAIMRREDFEPAARVRLFSDLAEEFRRHVEFPAEATEGIADEQYVRNVVDVLYRTATTARNKRQPAQP